MTIEEKTDRAQVDEVDDLCANQDAFDAREQVNGRAQRHHHAGTGFFPAPAQQESNHGIDDSGQHGRDGEPEARRESSYRTGEQPLPTA